MSMRPAAVCGLFYPGEPEVLRQTVHRLLRQARVPSLRQVHPPKGLIVPHAGYEYSGPIAATGYAVLQPWRGKFSRVVLLGTSHYADVQGAVFCPCESYETPLGPFPVEVDTLERLHQRGLAQPHAAAHRREHSLEVQLPFLHEVLGPVPLVPLTMGRCSQQEAAQVVEMLWNGPDSLLVLSTDLSHYLPYDLAQKTDHQTAQAIQGLQPEALDPQDACGFYALRGLLAAARQHRCTVQAVDLRNSGDTAGGRGEVVGYGSFVLWEPEARSLEAS